MKEPFVAFETERLVVRRLRRDDLDDFARLCGDPEIIRYMDNGEPLSRERTVPTGTSRTPATSS